MDNLTTIEPSGTSLATATIAKLKELGCSDTDIVVCGTEMIKSLAKDVAETYEEVSNREEAEGASEDIRELCVALIEATILYMNIICPEGRQPTAHEPVGPTT